MLFKIIVTKKDCLAFLPNKGNSETLHSQVLKEFIKRGVETVMLSHTWGNWEVRGEVVPCDLKRTLGVGEYCIPSTLIYQCDLNVHNSGTYTDLRELNIGELDFLNKFFKRYPIKRYPKLKGKKLEKSLKQIIEGKNSVVRSTGYFNIVPFWGAKNPKLAADLHAGTTFHMFPTR